MALEGLQSFGVNSNSDVYVITATSKHLSPAKLQTTKEQDSKWCGGGKHWQCMICPVNRVREMPLNIEVFDSMTARAGSSCCTLIDTVNKTDLWSTAKHSTKYVTSGFIPTSVCAGCNSATRNNRINGGKFALQGEWNKIFHCYLCSTKVMVPVVLDVGRIRSLQTTYRPKVWINRRHLGMLTDFHKRQFS
jgi:hypothetical protein